MFVDRLTKYMITIIQTLSSVRVSKEKGPFVNSLNTPCHSDCSLRQLPSFYSTMLTHNKPQLLSPLLCEVTWDHMPPLCLKGGTRGGRVGTPGVILITRRLSRPAECPETHLSESPAAVQASSWVSLIQADHTCETNQIFPDSPQRKESCPQ